MNHSPKHKTYRAAAYFCGVATITLTLVAVAFLLRARPQARLNACISNLKSIEMAKHIVAVEQRLAEGDAVPKEKLNPLLKESWPLKCPAGGTYSINPIGSNAACSYPGHAIP
jgi:hypothetical protein